MNTPSHTLSVFRAHPTPRDHPVLFLTNAWGAGQRRPAGDLPGAPKLEEAG